jgi:hypothetical protein
MTSRSTTLLQQLLMSLAYNAPQETMKGAQAKFLQVIRPRTRKTTFCRAPHRSATPFSKSQRRSLAKEGSVLL